MSRFLKDIEFGFTKECEVLPIIKKLLMIIQFVN